MAAEIQEASGSSSSKKDLDADQIQNLINMALSNAYDSVSSWLQPPSAAVIAADEKLKMSNQEFEKFAFRPLRLGVGAAAPTASTPKEMYKLKQKLAGTKRKADEIDSANGKGKAKADPEEDDDEESKSQSVSKKPKLGGTSALLAFEPSESVAKHKKKKKKKDKGRLDPGTMASQNDGALPPSGPASSSTATIIPERDVSSQSPVNGTAREEKEGSMAERPEAQAGSVEPEALPPDVTEKKRKKKKRKSSEEGHGGKSDSRASGGGNGDIGENQGDGEEDGEEWLGIPPSPPTPGSDMRPPPSPKPSKPTSAPSPDFKSTTNLDSRIYRHRPPRPTDTPTTQTTTSASIPSSIQSSYPPFASLTPSPPPNGRTDVHSHRSATLLPTLPNGDSSSPHKKKKKRKRVPLDQAQALDEQSSEATLVSSSDHTARMTSPRE